MTESTLKNLIEIFDVTPVPGDGSRFTGDSDGGERDVVDGSQILAQSIVAAGKALPGRTARSAHALFVGAARPDRPLEFAVAPVRAGRSFGSAVVTVAQGDRTCVTATVLLDSPQPDVVRHDRPAAQPSGYVSGKPSAGPAAARTVSMPLPGRELRVEDVTDLNGPDEVGPPVVDAWLRYDIVPDRDDLRRALLSHFTGHLSISTAFRAHAGIGTSQAHHTVSTAPMGIGVSFHDPVGWDGWLRYHHESTFAGAGMAYSRGQVLTEAGRILASFTQDSMIRAIDPDAASMAARARL
ncbi:MAG: thioesterase family protein [Streptosporangiales bacterium]|nr:thioesterase family protein [Streptosporangiales bacterium]